ncbi:MAG: M23 family metallopeptidase, partial [Bacilli bacterium]|nr:M23 family metallopeptidase [Bacilli bacterium]
MDNLLEIEKARLKRKHKYGINLPKSPKKNNPLKNQIITHVLIAIIFVLGSAIYIYWSDENKEMYKKNVFETSLSFTTINEWYEKEFGKVIPIDLNNITTPVNKNENDYSKISKYQNGVSVEVSKDSIISALNSGIVVFIGEKENYGNVVIVQGIDGVDVWYGNI